MPYDVLMADFTHKPAANQFNGINGIKNRPLAQEPPITGATLPTNTSSSTNLPSDVKFTSRPFTDQPVQPTTAKLDSSSQQLQQPTKPQQVVKVVNKRPGRFSLLRLSCRSIACLGCLLPLVLLLIIVFVVLFKPDPVWGRAKAFLNDELKPGEQASLAAPNTLPDLDASMLIAPDNPDGSKTIILTEAELAAILSRSIKDSEHFYLDLQPQTIRIMIDLDQNQAEPLWFFIDLSQNQGVVEVSRSGFGRADMPGGVVALARDNVNRSLDFINLKSDDVLVEEFLGRKDLDVTRVDVQTGQMVLDLKRREL